MTDYAAFLAGKTQYGAATGFEPTFLPDYLFGFQHALVDWAVRQGRAAIFADCGLGKAQPVDEPVLTLSGWRPIGSLAVGDLVIAVDGEPTRVLGVFPQGQRDTMRVQMNDGSSTTCDADHLWTVATDLDISRGRPWRTLTTRQLIAAGLNLPPRNGPRWRVPIVDGVHHPTADLPIDPYVMGVLLGDGSFRPLGGPEFTTVDDQIAAEVKTRLPESMRMSAIPPGNRAARYRLVIEGTAGSGGRTNPFLRATREWGLHGVHASGKFIPREYLHADPYQRFDLLRGLMDTDGYVAASGTIQFSSSSLRLAEGVTEIVRSLGGVTRMNSKIPTYRYLGERKFGQRHYTLTIALPDGIVPFLLERKVARCRGRYYVPQRKIVSIEPAGRSECVCIRVEHPSQLYVTRDHIVTHNTPMQLAWAENIRKETGKPVLIVTPLAVSFQTEAEADKFGIEAARSRDGKVAASITITNYDQLEKFDPDDFGGVVCDESSAIKSFDGQRRAIVTEFMRTMAYRLLCTATAAPNDYIELGTSSEALGHLGHMDMLNRFFINNAKTSDTKGRWRGHAAPRAFEGQQWRFKGHAELGFWRWVSSWARAVRRPSDLGFPDDGYDLPPLSIRTNLVEASRPAEGFLFDVPAIGLHEEREEARRTITERCEKAAEVLADASPGVAWCHLNDEGNLLTKLIDGAVQVSGTDSPDEKEEKLLAFSRGEIRVLVTKPVLGAWGLNWQHCHRMTFFPSHSYEQYYQAVRRSWRFGQQHEVLVDIVTTPGGRKVFENLSRKAVAADKMFDALTANMRDAQTIRRDLDYPLPIQIPAWIG